MKDLVRLQRAIRIALGESRCTGAAYFGSVATGTVDEFSDADLIVCCDHDAGTRFCAALDQYLDVVLYRPFDSREPSGRYWFNELSPYAKLDVSFHPPREFNTLLAEGGPFIEPPFLEVDVATSHQPVLAVAQISPNTSQEIAFSKLLYKYQVGTKNALRGKPYKEDIEALDVELRRAAKSGVSNSVVRLYIDTKRVYSARQRPLADSRRRRRHQEATREGLQGARKPPVS